VGAFIREEASEILRREVTDPRIGFVTVTRVEVTNDLRLARIFVSVLGDAAAKKETMAGLKSACPFIRRMIGPRLNIRFVPEIEFKVDETVEESIRIMALFRQIEEQKKSPQALRKKRPAAGRKRSRA
jgi:ribosome-binding factor A